VVYRSLFFPRLENVLEITWGITIPNSVALRTYAWNKTPDIETIRSKLVELRKLGTGREDKDIMTMDPDEMAAAFMMSIVNDQGADDFEWKEPLFKDPALAMPIEIKTEIPSATSGVREYAHQKLNDQTVAARSLLEQWQASRCQDSDPSLQLCDTILYIDKLNSLIKKLYDGQPDGVPIRYNALRNQIEASKKTMKSGTVVSQMMKMWFYPAMQKRKFIAKQLNSTGLTVQAYLGYDFCMILNRSFKLLPIQLYHLGLLYFWTPRILEGKG
jgi:hypothetical protein